MDVSNIVVRENNYEYKLVDRISANYGQLCYLEYVVTRLTDGKRIRCVSCFDLTKDEYKNASLEELMTVIAKNSGSEFSRLNLSKCPEIVQTIYKDVFIFEENTIEFEDMDAWNSYYGESNFGTMIDFCKAPENHLLDAVDLGDPEYIFVTNYIFPTKFYEEVVE